MLTARSITKEYAGTPVVQDISITLRDGELVSLIGMSGVGKTTLFHVLAGVSNPEYGQVLLDDIDVTGCPGSVSYMLQKDLLLPHKTILDNVSLPLVIRGKRKREARATALPYFAIFGIEGCENKYPNQLSGGMRQRAALLRTYLFSGKVLLLDEPFSALDAMTKSELHRWYLEISEKMGFSTLFITHDIDEAIRLSNRVYVMAGVPGRIVGEVEISAPHPRNDVFITSPEFGRYKKELLGRLG